LAALYEFDSFSIRMSTLKSVSIVIPVRNGRQFLGACLDSLLAEQARTPDLTVEIIVVDNASEDHSADWVAQHYPTVRLVRNLTNQGFAGGCNRGVEAGSGAVTILLNQDTCIRPGWVQALVAAFADPSIALAGCKILYPDGKTLQHAGGWIEWPLGHGYHYGHHTIDQGQWNESRPVEWVTGAALAIRRSLLPTIGLLDEEFWPGYFEDVDFCLRVRRQGFQVWYCAAAGVTHQETSSRIERAALTRFYQRGRLRMTLKHLPPQRWLDEFVPAEAAYMQGLGTPDRLLLQTAYLETVLFAPRLLAQIGYSDVRLIARVVQALRDLSQALHSLPSAPVAELAVPPLTEFTFMSSAPVIGRWLVGFRQLWYNVAARWAIGHLRDQLAAIHRLYEQQFAQQRRINEQYERQFLLLQHQLDQAVLKNGALAQQLVHLQASTTPQSTDT
jgi:GT2 family glycosyltransferase